MTDYTYSLGICYTGLEDVAWGVPQWLTHASQGETLVAVQPLRWDVTAVKFWNWRPGGFLKSCWLSVYTGLLKKPRLTPTTTGNEGTYQSRGEASKPKATFFLGPLLKMWAGTKRQKAWLRFRVGRPATNDLIKKIPPRSAQRLRFLLIPDVVNLTGKITITNLYQRTCKCFFFIFAKPFLLESSVQNSGGNTVTPALSLSEWALRTDTFLSRHRGKVQVTRYAQLRDNSNNNKLKQVRVFTDKLVSITTICIETIIK